ncbi:MAG: heavy metal translocating P-type ATPase [Acidobacteria bacterium]|nr:heavy metal translocating P-type ATPase [Acidobacteriota bacterium]
MTSACTVCRLHAESTFRIEGMDCHEEVVALERRFRNLPGLEDFAADVMGQRLHVKYDAARLTTSAIADAVGGLGMRAWLEHEEPIGIDRRPERLRQSLVWASGAAIAAGLALEWTGGPPSIARVLFVAAVAAGAPITAWRALHAVRSRALDINVLMLAAATGAALLGQWAEAAAVVFLFGVAHTLETRTLERARLAIGALLDLTPAEALVRGAGGDRRVGIDQVAIGDLIVVRPGEKVPLDGRVVAGSSSVNQAPITGESMPVDKAAGDEVFAGTVNGHGALDVEVTRRRRDTTLARIIHLVERAQAQRAPAQALVERFARVYTPAMLALALAVALAPPLVAGAAWPTWIYRALVLLVISCPCALVISTPVSIVAALAGAARKGVLIKGGVYLERTGEVRCVAFDKTGTLTRGTPELVDIVPLDGAAPEAIVAMAAAIETRSTHPIARAILKHASAASIPPARGERVTSFGGLGAEGLVDGAPVLLGNHRLFEERKLCSPRVHDALDRIGARGLTPVLVARDGVTLGVIAVADRARASGRDAIDLLRRQGVEAIVMLTGDNARAAKTIADELGVDEVRAELLPQDKQAVVQELRGRFGAVAMVGDGVNDAPALATADVGIAMGVAGSDAALETADIALMADELLKLPYAFRLSRKTVRNIKANLTISLVMKAAFVAAAIMGVATLWMAVLADTGASVVVIANALRLIRAD